MTANREEPQMQSSIDHNAAEEEAAEREWEQWPEPPKADAQVEAANGDKENSRCSVQPGSLCLRPLLSLQEFALA